MPGFIKHGIPDIFIIYNCLFVSVQKQNFRYFSWILSTIFKTIKLLVICFVCITVILYLVLYYVQFVLIAENKLFFCFRSQSFTKLDCTTSFSTIFYVLCDYILLYYISDA